MREPQVSQGCWDQIAQCLAAIQTRDLWQLEMGWISAMEYDEAQAWTCIGGLLGLVTVAYTDGFGLEALGVGSVANECWLAHRGWLGFGEAEYFEALTRIAITHEPLGLEAYNSYVFLVITVIMLEHMSEADMVLEACRLDLVVGRLSSE